MKSMHVLTLRLCKYSRKCRFSRKLSTHAKSTLSKLIIPDRSYLQISGKDTKKFLQGLCTNDVSTLENQGQAIATAFLTAKGRVMADTLIYNISDDKDPSHTSFIIDVQASMHHPLLSMLRTYKLRSAVTIDVVNYMTVMDMDGSASSLSPDPRSSLLQHRTIHPISSSSSGEDIAIAQARSISTRYRYHHGIAEGQEIHDHIPMEANLDFLNYISFAKGCYIGQELIARTKFKGLIRKRMVPFQVLDPHDDTSYNNFDKMDKNFTIDDNTFTSSSSHIISADDRIYADDKVDSIGKVIAYDSTSGLGLAMARLDSLFYPKPLIFHIKSSSPSSSSSSSSGSSRIRFRKPIWWPDVDAQTGKKIDDIQPE